MAQTTIPGLKSAAPPSFDALADSALIRAKDLVRDPRHPGRPVVLPLGQATFWRWVANGQFPKPMKIAGGVSAWRVGDVRTWLAQQASGDKPQAATKFVGAPQAPKATSAPQATPKPTREPRPRKADPMDIVRALRTGPKTTAQLEALGTSRFTARLHALRQRGYEIERKRDYTTEQGRSSLYVLVSEPAGGAT